MNDIDLLQGNTHVYTARLIGETAELNAISLKNTLPVKLFIHENFRVVLVNAPDYYQSLLSPLSEGAIITSNISPDSDFIQVFIMNCIEMENQLSALKDHLKQD